MKLRASVGISKDDTFHFVSFYDHDQLYGFSLTRIEGDKEVEVMVADQSAYRPRSFKVTLSEGKLVAQLPPGTIAPVDGEDYYEIEFELNDLPYQSLVTALRKVFTGVVGSEVEIV